MDEPEWLDALVRPDEQFRRSQPRSTAWQNTSWVFEHRDPHRSPSGESTTALFAGIAIERIHHHPRARPGPR